jgi:hypothetical protein
MGHLKYRVGKTEGNDHVDCTDDPTQSLVTMFVDMVQRGRIKRGQCPALRPVFLKPHGIVHGVFRMKDDIPDWAKVGLFSGREYPLWIRFSSDTLPTRSDFKTTLGVGLKLFDTPTPKLFGLPDETTFDFIMQNMDVFFVDTAKDMCEFTKADVVDGDYQPYLKTHPKTQRILDEMAKPVGSCLASPYWSILPFSLGALDYVKYKLEPTISVPPPPTAPADPTYLACDLRTRLLQGDAVFRFCIQRRTNPDTMPLDEATVRWPEEQSRLVSVHHRDGHTGDKRSCVGASQRVDTRRGSRVARHRPRSSEHFGHRRHRRSTTSLRYRRVQRHTSAVRRASNGRPGATDIPGWARSVRITLWCTSIRSERPRHVQ